jgi:hypothetical protein
MLEAQLLDYKAMCAHMRLEMDADASSHEQRAFKAEALCSTLQLELMSLSTAAHDSETQLQKLSEQLRLAQAQARCAPSYAKDILQFLRVKCVHGPDLRVATVELYTAFLSYVNDTSPPTQREFRALLEHLGFEYDHSCT